MLLCFFSDRPTSRLRGVGRRSQFVQLLHCKYFLRYWRFLARIVQRHLPLGYKYQKVLRLLVYLEEVSQLSRSEFDALLLDCIFYLVQNKSRIFLVLRQQGPLWPLKWICWNRHCSGRCKHGLWNIESSNRQIPHWLPVNTRCDEKENEVELG